MFNTNHGGNANGLPRRRAPDRLQTSVLLLACILLLALIPARALAQDSISEITVVAGGSPPPAPHGYTRIDVDLNRDAGGDFVYVCWKKGVGAPITGLAVTYGGSWNQAAPGPGYHKIGVDLNQGVGGDFIFIWYTKDPACSTIRDITVVVGRGAQPPPGYTRINVDLNRNAGGNFIYLCYRLGNP